MFCDSRGKILSNSKIYDVLVDEGIMSLPDASTILDSRYNNNDRVNGVLKNYDSARKALFTKFGWGAIGKYMDYDGKLNDNVFMAMITAGEFSSEKGDAYLESVEALSNQYYGETKFDPGPMQCRGNCNIKDQLRWATQMQAWYSSDFIKNVVSNDLWMTQLDTADDAIGRYQHGADDSWFWGDVAEADIDNYNLTTPYVYHPENEPLPYYIVYSSEK